MWRKRLDSGNGAEGTGITVDSSGNVYVIGKTYDSGNDFVVLKMSGTQSDDNSPSVTNTNYTVTTSTDYTSVFLSTSSNFTITDFTLNSIYNPGYIFN